MTDTESTPTSERYVIGIEGLNQLGGLDIHWQGGGLLGDGGTDDNGIDVESKVGIVHVGNSPLAYFDLQNRVTHLDVEN